MLLNPLIALLHHVFERGDVGVIEAVGVLVWEQLECTEIHVGDVQDILAVHAEGAIVRRSDGLDVCLPASGYREEFSC